MSIITDTSFSFIRGMTESLKGTITIFYLDKHIKERAKSSPSRENLKSKSETSSRNKKVEEPKVLKRTIQCCLLNGGVFWFSMLLFDSFILPGLRYIFVLMLGPVSGLDVWIYLKLLLNWTFSAFWVLPLFILSKIVNCLWFQDIADSAYRHTRGRPQMLSSFSVLIADTLFSVFIQILFIMQSMLIGLIPYIGTFLSLIHMCMLHSLYSFEYKWVNMGWELHRRLTFIENNWPYFLGFSFILAILTSLPSSYIVSGCVFSILFPLFIISGNEAEPVTTTKIFPLRLFTPVIVISNTIFNKTIGTKAG